MDKNLYQPVDTNLDFVAREQEVLKFWQDEDIINKNLQKGYENPATRPLQEGDACACADAACCSCSGENMETCTCGADGVEDCTCGGKKAESCQEVSNYFSFYDGPPTANGRPHIGHVLTRVIKDIIPRYRVMKGYNVLRKAGWDTHGLPVELEVEKKLGFHHKTQIEEYGVDRFIEHCKESVWVYKTEWEEMSSRLAYWVDMDDPYVTYDNSYIESVWWALKKIWDKGLIYYGHKILPYCPRCGTALSSHEVAQGYKTVKETSIYVRFKVKGHENRYFTAWTTTPWTLPSNVALCVGPEIDYILIRLEDGTEYYVAEALCASLFGEKTPYEVIEKMKGKDLEFLEYEPILPYALPEVDKFSRSSRYLQVKDQHAPAFFITLADYVSLEDGTGIVHIAPAFGEDDAKVGKAYDLPFVQFVNADGTLPEAVTDFAGVFCKEADPKIIEKLKNEGSLLKTAKTAHNYPFCWRCDTPLIYYARDGWFINMQKVKADLLANNEKIHWMPENIGTGRFGNFLENVVDWTLSRERYWGTPLPIWQCECGHELCVGSISQLRELASNCPEKDEDMDLHKPFLAKLDLKCPECGKTMHRVPEVIDCWFDSGSMPFAQFHYPFEHQEEFEHYFPATFISEAIDQTRGWFYSLLAISTLLFDRPSYKNCLVLGHVLDEKGLKMSKHLGNVVDPMKVLEEEGADALRWYFYTNSQPWLPSSFSLQGVSEAKRRFMGIFWNSYSFYVLYANIDHFNPFEHKLDMDNLGLLDRWILTGLNDLIDRLDHLLASYEINRAAKALEVFVDELSNWYLRRSRERFWAPGMEEDKVNAYMTLYTALSTLCRLAAPFTPFLAETIYQNLVQAPFKALPEAKQAAILKDQEGALAESVHLTLFPKPIEGLKADPTLLEQMAYVLRIVTLGRNARNLSNIKTRQPLPRVYVASTDPDLSGVALPAELENLVKDELNVKEVSYMTDATSLQDYVFKPQLKVLGKRFGKDLPQVRQVLEGLDGAKAFLTLQDQGYFTLDINGEEEKFATDDLIIEAKKKAGISATSEGNLTIALDTEINEDLWAEGLLREFASKAQNLRKEADYAVDDLIDVWMVTDPRTQKILQADEVSTKRDIMAKTFSFLPLKGDAKELEAAATLTYTKSAPPVSQLELEDPQAWADLEAAADKVDLLKLNDQAEVKIALKRDNLKRDEKH